MAKTCTERALLPPKLSAKAAGVPKRSATASGLSPHSRALSNASTTSYNISSDNPLRLNSNLSLFKYLFSEKAILILRGNGNDRRFSNIAAIGNAVFGIDESRFVVDVVDIIDIFDTYRYAIYPHDIVYGIGKSKPKVF